MLHIPLPDYREWGPGRRTHCRRALHYRRYKSTLGLPVKPLGNERLDAADGNTLLLLRVAMPHGHRLIRQCLRINGHAERRADLVHAGIPFADGLLGIVFASEMLADFEVQLFGDLRHAVFVDQREDAQLDRGEAREEFQVQPAGSALVSSVYASAKEHKNRAGQAGPLAGSITFGTYRLFALTSSSLLPSALSFSCNS